MITHDAVNLQLAAVVVSDFDIQTILVMVRVIKNMFWVGSSLDTFTVCCRLSATELSWSLPVRVWNELPRHVTSASPL